MVAGIIGNIVKTNASISGAEVGCQGEIGVACSMASAALTYLENGDNYDIEYAGEVALRLQVWHESPYENAALCAS